MNKRARTLARLKLSRACKDNPDLPRKLVFSLLISEYQGAYPAPALSAIPTFQNDEEAENFVATADLSEYDLSGGTVVHFEIEKHEDAYWAEKAEEGINSGFLGQSETRKFMEEKLTLDQAMAITFAQNSEVKRHYNEMEEEYQIKAPNIEAATHKGSKHRVPRRRVD